MFRVIKLESSESRVWEDCVIGRGSRRRLNFGRRKSSSKASQRQIALLFHTHIQLQCRSEEAHAAVAVDQEVVEVSVAVVRITTTIYTTKSR